MIEYIPKKVLFALCDSCEADVAYNKNNISHVNYAKLKNCFGYGSKLDNCLTQTEFHLCEDCYLKILDVLNLNDPAVKWMSDESS